MPKFLSTQGFARPVLMEAGAEKVFFSHAVTLGELLHDFGAAFGCKFTPHDEPKYFRYYADESCDDYALVDIHITRRGTACCPKQDLNFGLEPDDIVEAGELEC